MRSATVTQATRSSTHWNAMPDRPRALIETASDSNIANYAVKTSVDMLRDGLSDPRDSSTKALPFRVELNATKIQDIMLMLRSVAVEGADLLAAWDTLKVRRT